MKIASILAGVAVAALTASAASAGTINQGQATVPIFGTVNVPVLGVINLGVNQANAQNGNSSYSSWHANGQSGANSGSVGDTGEATFTLKGTVATDCAYYSGSSNDHTLNFGTIGIYADENAGPANLFTMTQDASVEINTNAAGCNTANTVKISKTNLVSDNVDGYDNTTFTNTLPFSVKAKYKAANAGAPAAGVNQVWIDVPANLPGGQKTHGAWKSPMSLDVKIARPTQALLAGTYTGSVSVMITAGI
ncbi:MAG: hypothetical protein IE910_11930 [Brevundimonas sp.]|nr:hypothetical protein [Brevundimonas sp.]